MNTFRKSNQLQGSSNKNYTFSWKCPDQIDTYVGSNLLRQPNPLHTIMHEKAPGYTQEVVEYMKQVCHFAGKDSFVVQTDTGKFKNFYNQVSRLPLLHKFSNTMQSLLKTDQSPRVFRFPVDYTPKHDNTDKDTVYNLVKLYQFYTNPPDFFRTPFSLGAKKKNFLMIHPGNYRLISTLFLPNNIPCTLLFPTKFNHWLSYFGIDNHKDNTVCSMNSVTLSEIFNLSLYNKITVSYSSITGIQLMEHHTQLEEYKKEFVIEWTGRHFVVNDVIVASLSNGVFNPPKPLG